MLPLAVEDLARESNWVVRGTVREVSPQVRTVNGRNGIYTTVAVEVDEWLVGSGPRIQRLLVHGGRVGNQASVVHGQARFRVGEEVVLFLYRAGEAVWLTGMSQGKWIVNRDGRVESARDPSALTRIDRTSVLPPPGVMPLSELRNRVQAGASR